eukprot:TRINITY_DN5775_c0_g1_i1.p1 TRINITY_DN5775_c0_g1~~TRINITY_DN5775_c0_g1_i1.p1  ORF type:complete len:164 (+),score=57.11 TRINITY_DN5775_c0_g1_i1:48-539(+)
MFKFKKKSKKKKNKKEPIPVPVREQVVHKPEKKKEKDLWEAAKQGDIDHIKDLFKKGIGISARDSDGCTVIHYLAEFGHQDALEQVLSLHKINIDSQDRWGMTPLHRAVFNSQQQTSISLILRGADVHLLSEGGVSALQKAFEMDEQFSAPLMEAFDLVQEGL